MKKLRFAVLGAGAGGQTMAAFLTEKGYPVRLYDHNLTRIQQLQTRKTIRATWKMDLSGNTRANYRFSAAGAGWCRHHSGGHYH